MQSQVWIRNRRLFQIFLNAAPAALVSPFQFNRHSRAVGHFLVAVVHGHPFDAVLFNQPFPFSPTGISTPSPCPFKISGLLFFVLI